MTTYSRADVVLVEFGYTDGSGRAKLRPAYILSTDLYHSTRRKVIIGAITSNVQYANPGDWVIRDWKAAGLHAASRAVASLQTSDILSLGTKLGQLSDYDFRNMEQGLRNVLGL